MQLGGVAIEILWGRKVWLMWVFFVFRSACGLGFYYCLCRLAPGKLNEQLYQSTLLYLILLER